MKNWIEVRQQLWKSITATALAESPGFRLPKVGRQGTGKDQRLRSSIKSAKDLISIFIQQVRSTRTDN